MLRLSKCIFHDAVWNLSNICIHDSSADASIDSSWLYSEQSSTVYQESSSILSSYSCMFSQCVLSQSNCSHRATCLSSICLWSSKKNNKQYRTQTQKVIHRDLLQGLDRLYLYFDWLCSTYDGSWWFYSSLAFGSCSSICTCISQTACSLSDGFRLFFWRIVFHS